MPGFFGDPYVARYTGPTAHDAISDVLAGQQQGFNQNEKTKEDAANGIFLQDKDFGAFHDAQMQGDLGQMSDAMSANAAGMGTDIARGIQGGSPDQGAGLMRLRAGGNGSATPAGMPASGAPGTTQGVESAAFGGGTVVPQGHPAAAPQSPLGRRPIAGELMPAQGRFATTVDGQQHDQATAALASGLPPAGLMATHAGQGAQGTQGPSVGVAAQMAGHPGAYHMPAVNITARRPSPPAAAPQPAPAAAPPEAAPLPAAAPQDPQLVNAQAQAAMISPDQASQMAPSVPQFLSRQGIPSSLALPSGGGVSYGVPLLKNAYEATTAANLAAAQQNAQTGRTQIEQGGANQRSANEIAGANQRSASEQGTQRDIATQGRASQERIAAQTYDLRKMELNKQLEQMEVMFGFKKDQQTQKGMDDIVKGASKEEDQLTGADDAIKMLQLAKTNPSLGTGAQIRQFMVSNGINSARVSEALDHLAETGMDPSVGGHISRFLSGAADGVPPAQQLDAATKAMQQVRGSLFQTYDRKLMAGARQHSEIPDAVQRIRVRQMTIAPDLVQGAGGGAGGSTSPSSGGASGALRPVSQSEWDTIKKAHNLSDDQMGKYYSVGSPRG